MASTRIVLPTCLVAAWLGAPAAAQVTTRVSVSTGGTEANSTSASWHVSRDGRFVTFVSQATNLVGGDGNGSADVFVHDLLTGTTERVSIDSGGVEGDADSDDNSISDDGRFVAFASSATNLVTGDTNGFRDIFVRDRVGNTTERVSLDSGGAEADADCALGGGLMTSISGDGRFVAFHSEATNLVVGDTNAAQDVFVRDRLLGTTERVSVDSIGTQSDFGSEDPKISADGRYVAFQSDATNLVAGDTNGASDIFVHDRQTGTTERVSVATGGAEGGAPSLQPRLSGNGRYVAFSSDAVNLVGGDTNGATDVFVRDRQAATTIRVSVDSSGAQATGTSPLGAISFDGRFVTFASDAPDLVAGDTNGIQDVFLRDLLDGTTSRVSVDTQGNEADGPSSWPAVSGDGSIVLFESDATNLVAGDTNGALDCFVHATGAGGTETESVGIGGAPANGASSETSISADQRFVAFESDASNLVAGDVNGVRDVFVRDRQAATTTLVSVATGGAQGNGPSSRPSISSDGRYVAFESAATNLVAGDTNAASDAFVHDLQNGVTTRVSVTTAGGQANGASAAPAISGDGGAIAFESLATNLVTGDTNGVLDVFVRDGLTSLVSTTTRASVDSGGTQGNGPSGDATISSNGALVGFESGASNLVASDSNLVADVFVRDRVGGATTRVSVDSGGTQGAMASDDPSISSNGRYVAFASAAGNLVGGDSNLVVDVFLRDRTAATTIRVSVDSGGTQGAMASDDPSTSADGRFVAFASDAANLVGGDANASTDVFVRDVILGTTVRVSVDASGAEGAGSSSNPSISADGRHVAFESDAPNLVAGDTNGLDDAFVRDLGTASSFEAFCFGDGTGAPCPCANSGAPGHGCENSSTTGGALLTVTGVASLSADTVQFTSSGEKPTALSIFLQGTTVTAPVVYGDGLRCVGGALKRLYAKSAVGGVVVAPVGADLSVSARSAFLNQPIPLGSTRSYMVYYRDVNPATFCPTPQGSNFNGTNGMIVAWGG